MSVTGRSRYISLVRRCLAGDERAWEEIVAVISPIVFGVCRSKKLTDEESLDIFGEVCYLLLQNLPKLKSPERILSYVATTTRWEIYGMFRRARLQDKLKQKDVAAVRMSAQPGPDEEAVRTENQRVLLSAILRLPETESRLMWHLFFDERQPTYQEISQQLGIPVASIGPTRGRCLKKLKRMLKRKGYQF